MRRTDFVWRNSLAYCSCLGAWLLAIAAVPANQCMLKQPPNQHLQRYCSIRGTATRGFATSLPHSNTTTTNCIASLVWLGPWKRWAGIANHKWNHGRQPHCKASPRCHQLGLRRSTRLSTFRDSNAQRVSENQGGGIIVITDHTNCYFHNTVLQTWFMNWAFNSPIIRPVMLAPIRSQKGTHGFRSKPSLNTQLPIRFKVAFQNRWQR